MIAEAQKSAAKKITSGSPFAKGQKCDADTMVVVSGDRNQSHCRRTAVLNSYENGAKYMEGISRMSRS